MLLPLSLANPSRGAWLSLEEEVVGGGAVRRGERSARGVRVAGRGARGAGARVVRTVEARGRAEGTAEAGVLAVGRKVGSEAGVRGPQRPALGAVTRRDRSRPPRWVKVSHSEVGTLLLRGLSSRCARCLEQSWERTVCLITVCTPLG